MEEMTLAEELDARRRIADVIHAYCRHVDAYEPTKIAALFAKDCVVDYGPAFGAPLEGPKAVADALDRALGVFEATHHQVSNVEIALESRNRATGLTYVTAWHRLPGDAPDAVVYGQYHDVFVRNLGRWEIAERRLQAAGQTGLDVPFAPTPRRPRPESPAPGRDAATAASDGSE